MQITNDIRANRATISVFENALRRNGLTMPPAPAPKFETPKLPTRADVTDAALKVLRAGKDPAADSGVQKLTTAYQLAGAGLKEQAELAHTKDHLEHIAQEAPALLEQVAEQFEEAVDTMRKSIPSIGHVDLSKGIQFTPGGGTTKLIAMAEAAEALNKVTVIIDTWGFLMAAAGETPEAGAQYKRLWYTHPTWEQFTSHRLAGHLRENNHGRAHSVWDMLNDGIDISLATTAAEYEQRVEQLTEQEQAAEHRAAQQERDRRPNYSSIR